MNQSHQDPWRGPGGPPQPDTQGQGRPFGGFGPPNGPSQGPPHVLPPPSSSYHQHHPQPSSGHNLSIADLTQGSQGPQHPYNSQPPPQSQGHSLPPLGHSSMSQHSPQYMNRERELADRREREYREQEMRERERDIREREMQQRHHEEMMMMREREARERQERMQREQEQRPVQSHAGSIPLHQPVANKVQNSIHGPNGLLANSAPQQNGPSSTGPGSIFGAPAPEQQRPQFMQQPQQPVGGPPPPQQPAPAFLGGPSPMPAAAQLPHGQQPILNDALSYLDQVKVRFSDHPDVYNRFLDIMKDFKSQAIDTPGVIERVSNLFNGHPALIQGFNTFLPPGYRIECGTDDNPDAIRVTTPSGTMTQSLQGRPRGGPYESSNLSSQAQPGLSRDNAFEDRRRGWSQAPEDSSAIHQQEQRGVSSLQNAATAATQRGALPLSPPRDSASQQGAAFGGAAAAAAADLKRGGPVEFNHAISYVNKIKNRFAQQPEIYKQFLEILQTYQRESKPIQDVYAQVTQLFHSAPDLLEDFKQFLPETAAQAKAQASARIAMTEETSNVRGEPGYAAGGLPQAQTPRPAAKMPPMGQFDPPSTSKDNKKRRGAPNTGATTSLESGLAQSSRGVPVQVGNANKRQKISNQRQPQTETVVTSPTLIPALPEPLPPYPPYATTTEELGFFDRAKKQISNRASYAEFLKLINLFSQDLIDKYTLSDRVISFIGSNPELMLWFRDFVGIQEQDEIIDAKARIDPGRVNLSHCRALGPSYRHLPKRDQTKTCKGRDGMCYEVLNDVWASHPTWASEDSGFVAHRKNQHEEALHRIEEERHDYDFHIESCQRTIQLMEPIVQQFAAMSEMEKSNFQLAPGFGGASESIPKRIIMKIYGRETGGKVLAEMYAKPLAVMPIVLQRLKQKLEEWKSTQREWEKVWRDQINKQFWKSLDHQGINIRSTDKKAFQQKQLTGEIQNKYEEDKKNRENGNATKRHHLEFKFDDVDVIVDATRLILITLVHDRNDRNGFSQNDQERVKAWILDFLPKYFGLNPEEFTDQVKVEVADIPEDQDGNESDGVGPRKNRKGGLIRRVFDKRNGNSDSAPNSKESTPIPTTEHDMDVDEEIPQSDSEDKPKAPWINVTYGDVPTDKVSLEESYSHETFNLYANVNIYCFFRMFETLYSRLLAVKNSEAQVIEAVKRHRGTNDRKKPAIELRMIDKGPEYFFNSIVAKEPHHYYHEILQMCEDVIQGNMELSHLEETLRRYYNKTGWQLYTIDKLLSSLLRYVANILGGDAKDKSIEIANLFFKDRERPDTTRRQEIEYRKHVERLSKDGEVFRISYTPENKVCTIRYFPSEDPTFDSDALTDDQLWQYYVASYTMSEATEGIDKSNMHMPYLRRNVAPQSANIDHAFNHVFGNITHFDNQTAFISPDNYKLLLSNDYIFWRHGLRTKKAYQPGKINESDKFRESFVRNTKWMENQSQEYVEGVKAEYERNIRDGFPASA